MKTHSRFLPTATQRHVYSMAVLLGLCTSVVEAKSDCLPARERLDPSTTVTVANRELATQRFQLGNTLLEKRDFEGALELFLKSRALWYHWANTLNAAVCLAHLGRYHEALAFYEDILRDFPKEIAAKDREQIVNTVARLEKRVFRVHVEEAAGTLTVDSETCGTLPRAEAIYLLPGVHVFRIMHSGGPERSVLFDGHAGAVQTLRLPPLPPPPRPTAPSLPEMQLFLQASGGPAIEGARSYSNSYIKPMSGYLITMGAGYRFANDLVVALNVGRLKGHPDLERKEDKRTDDSQTFYRTRSTRGDFMGISIGWEPHDDRHFASLYRMGVGVLGTQSKSVIDVDADSGIKSVDEMGLEVQGRDIVYSVTPVANFEIGIAWQIGRFRVGFSALTMFLLAQGSSLPPVNILNQIEDRPYILKFDGVPSYRPSFLFVPQIVFGYDL